MANETKTNNQSFSVVNGEPFPCGCTANFSDGHGQYSDVIRIELCSDHFLQGNPEEDAKSLGMTRRADGSWK
jgi:hypothetical protein